MVITKGRNPDRLPQFSCRKHKTGHDPVLCLMGWASGLWLRAQLQEGDGRVRVAGLGHGERDLLRHALHRVKKFQQWLTLHFRLRQ